MTRMTTEACFSKGEPLCQLCTLHVHTVAQAYSSSWGQATLQ